MAKVYKFPHLMAMGSEVTAKSMSEDALHILIYDPLPPND
jgi:hypothetical protein